MAFPPATITPSEVAFLSGSSFASKGVLGNVTLLDGEKVAAHELARAIYMTAALSNERSGAARLEVRDATRLGGLLGTKRVLVAVATGTEVDWPAGSLEADFLAIVRARAEGAQVSKAFYAMIREDSPNGWVHAIEQAKHGLARRHLLEVEEGRALKVIKKHRYTLPPSTRALAEPSRISDVKAALEEVRASRPEVAHLLQKAVDGAAKLRTEQRGD